MTTKLYIGGLPKNVDELALARIIFPYGDVITMTIVRDRATKIGKGYAFIEVQDNEVAQAIIEGVDGLQYGDLTIDAKIADATPAKPAFKRKPMGGGYNKPGSSSSSYNKPGSSSYRSSGDNSNDTVNRSKRPRLNK